MRAGTVLYQETPAGTIRETERGYEFEYLRSWIDDPAAHPLSLTLPLTERIYTSPTIFPFFDGLIPEGWLLDLSVRNWKLDRRDRMGLLLAVCRDSIGAVSVVPAAGNMDSTP